MSLGWLVSGAYHPAHRKMQPTEAAQIAGTPTNLPLALVIASDAHFAAHARADAHDIAITLADGATELDYERVAWDSGTGALEIWLKDPSPESGDVYFIYYGDADQAADRQNATGVWDADFKTVQHLKDLTIGTVEDSTSNGYDGTKADDNKPIEIGAQIGQGQDFNAGAEIDFGDEADFALATYTWEIWIKGDTAPGTARVTQPVWNANVQFQFSWDHTNAAYKQSAVHDTAGNGWPCAQIASAISDGVRYYIVGTYNSTQIEVYLDGGSEDTQLANAPVTASGILRLGGGAAELLCELDEFRVSGIARDGNWIATNYNNQKSPAPGGTFWSALGSEEKESRYPAVVFQCPAIV